MITLRGQGSPVNKAGQPRTPALCKGQLNITLSGPVGSGKSLVVKLLTMALPLMGVDTVVIRERTTPTNPSAVSKRPGSTRRG